MIAMVSNMRFLQSSHSRHNPLRRPEGGSNMGAVLCRTSRALAIACLLMFRAPSVFAQQGSTVQPAQPDGHPVVETVKFIAGGALGLVMHESGHLIFDAAFDAKPRISRVQFGPIPFFAISHRDDLSPRREFTISSAGFWVQEATNEWLLTRRSSRNYLRNLSTTEDTEDRRFKPEEKYIDSVSPVPSVVASCNSATRFVLARSALEYRLAPAPTRTSSSRR